MKNVKGDLIQMTRHGDFDVLVHGCNCRNTMGSGIARQVKEHFPEAFKADCWAHTEALGWRGRSGDVAPSLLGGFSSAHFQRIAPRGRVGYVPIIVVNAYTQLSFGGDLINVDYDALRSAFSRIKEAFPNRRIGYPAIGAGLGGGDWGVISQIIDEELDGEDHTFVEYDPRA